jgi:hypothetical protein
MSLDGLSGLVDRVIAWADRLQREHGVLGFPYAVVKKYGDDEGGRQAALITYYGFLSIFPLLLLGVAVLSRVLADHPDLRQPPASSSASPRRAPHQPMMIRGNAAAAGGYHGHEHRPGRLPRTAAPRGSWMSARTPRHLC